ncbi:MAG: 50S ribosomal protein L1 [Deltaproteobacteria bacterium]|nr:50S ribosomal protein L1 [Deltaproteobacteria bacterium]MBI3016689.1 50S ribosomal protein L1 [Deltaproteobacteria bacterium]
MRKRSKKYTENRKKAEPQKKYDYKEALKLLIEMARSKFDETVDVAARMGVDPKQSDQQVRGAVVLPHGIGKSVRVVVFAKGEKEREASEQGADYVGSNDLVEKIQGGWFDFDKVIATPDMMGVVSKLGKILGPKGLMPNPKLGTVTFEIANAVKNEKKGKVEFRIDKTANLHTVIGKISFGYEKLKENFEALMEAVIKQKPSSSKGIYLKSLALSTTHSPSLRIDAAQLYKGSSDA